MGVSAVGVRDCFRCVEIRGNPTGDTVSLGRRIRLVKRGVRFAREDSRAGVVVAVAAGWFLSIGMRMVYPVLLPDIRAAYGLDLGMAGLLLTVLWGAYALGQLPGGILSDQFGERAVLAASTLASAAALALVVTAGFPAVVFVTTALFGFTTALYGVARYTALSKVFPDRAGTAIGVTLAAGNVGNAVLPATAGAVAAAFAWQYGFGLAVPAFVLVAAFLWVVVPRDPSETAGDTFNRETAARVLGELRRPPVLLVAVMLVFTVSVWQTFTGFYPTYLVEVKGLASTTAAVVFGFFFALAIVIQPLAGAIYDRVGIRRTLPLFLGATAAGFLLLPFVSRTPVIVAVTVLLGCMTSVIAVAMPYLTDLLPDDVQGTGLGLLRSSYMLVGAASPTVFGAVAEMGYFEVGFSALAVPVVGVTAIVLQLPEQS